MESKVGAFDLSYIFYYLPFLKNRYPMAHTINGSQDTKIDSCSIKSTSTESSLSLYLGFKKKTLGTIRDSIIFMHGLKKPTLEYPITKTNATSNSAGRIKLEPVITNILNINSLLIKVGRKRVSSKTN